MIKFYKILFMNTLIMGTMITLSAYSWFTMWIGLEINLMSFIPLILTKSPTTSESAMKYFIIQALSSMFLLFSAISIISINPLFIPSTPFYLIITAALLTKMGAAPMHFWLPEVIMNMTWTNSMIILTWQKLAPMSMLMFNMNQSKTLITYSIILSVLIGSIMGWNQTNLRKMLTFSSINHIGWMLSLILMNQSMWMTYFLIYSFILMNLILIFNWNNSNQFQQTIKIMNSNKSIKIITFMNMFSLGGLPPFLGFFPKWITLNELTNNKLIPLTLLMILSALITLFFYTRISLNSMTLFSYSIMEKKSTTPMHINFMNSLNIMGMIMAPILFMMM